MSDKPPPKPADKRQRRARGLLSVGLDVDKVLAPLSQKKGFAEFDLMRAWPAIIGEALASQCNPQRLVRGPEGRDGTLHLGVSGPLALELQHMTPQLIERINSHYGYRAVAKISFRQIPPSDLAWKNTKKKRPAGRGDGAAHAKIIGAAPADIVARAASIEDPELRAALIELGRSVRATESENNKNTGSETDRSQIKE